MVIDSQRLVSPQVTTYPCSLRNGKALYMVLFFLTLLSYLPGSANWHTKQRSSFENKDSCNLVCFIYTYIIYICHILYIKLYCFIQIRIYFVFCRPSSTLPSGGKRPTTTVHTTEYPPAVTCKKLSQMKPDCACVSSHTSDSQF